MTWPIFSMPPNCTIFLNSAFCIKRFTPSALSLGNWIPADPGRPISHLSHRFIGLDLVADAEGGAEPLRD